MGQKPSKYPTKKAFHKKSHRKTRRSARTTTDANEFNGQKHDKDFLNKPNRETKLCADIRNNYSEGEIIKRNSGTDQMEGFFEMTDPQNRNRIRRFRNKLARQLQRAEMENILEILLKDNVLNEKEYGEIKNQTHTKWMSWQLSYTLEQKIKNDDLKGNTAIFDRFLECLRDPKVKQSKLAGRLSTESSEPSSSWLLDGKDTSVLDLDLGPLVLTPSLLESVLSLVYCNNELSWWRWIPHELYLGDFNSNSKNMQTTGESEHCKLKNALFQWGNKEGFARGGFQVLILCLRNHNDACEVNWEVLRRLLKKSQRST